MNSFPSWLKKDLSLDPRVYETRAALQRARVKTVCESSLCPNLSECFAQGHATFLIAGPTCTRACAFCAGGGAQAERAAAPDAREPERILRAVRHLGLGHVVLTSVTRDDLGDGGSSHFAAVVDRIRAYRADITIEVLVPDFKGDRDAVRRVASSEPHVFGHNIETVPRLYGQVRPGFEYRRSLAVLRLARELLPGRSSVKSAILMGFGETRDEVVCALGDLRLAGCDMVTIGHYLRPSPRHIPVARYVEPDEFAYYGDAARAIGFRAVSCGPFVRSSYGAAALYRNAGAVETVSKGWRRASR